MTDISWNSFDGAKFQELCNALLHFEVSKKARLFSAPGMDEGVDQSYLGTYGDLEGLWRFQDKFHNSGNKASDSAAFKRDVIKDINEHDQGETILVFITNINLSKKKYEDILAEGRSELDKLGRNNCELDIWHFPKIQTALIAHPVVRTWFWGDQRILLEHFNDYFKNQLSDNKGYFTNLFLGRSSEIEYLNGFLKDSQMHGLSIIANTSYGKTRLVIEWLKSDYFRNTDFRALVLSHTGFDASELVTLLKCKTPYLIIIDDSHRIPQATQEVIRQINNSGGQHKYLLTTRPSTLGLITEVLPSHAGALDKLQLDVLSPAESKEIFRRELPWLTEIQIYSLANNSKGIPGIIGAMIALVRSGRQPSEISADEAFIDTVNQVVKEAQTDLWKRMAIAIDKSNRLIRSLALLGPLRNTQNDIQFLAELSEIKNFELRQALQELKNLGIIQYPDIISIRPEPYGEALVGQELVRNKDFIKFIVNRDTSGNYKTNMLKNMLQFESTDITISRFIDQLLEEQLETTFHNDIHPQKIVGWFKFVEDICIKRPALSVRVINQIIVMSQDVSHPMHNDTGSLSLTSYFKQIITSSKKQITSICAYSNYARINQQLIYELVLDLLNIYEDKNFFISCYSYRQQDFKEGTVNATNCCERQRFLKNKVCNELLNQHADERKLILGISGAEILLNLEFKLDEYFERDTMTIHFGMGKVHYCTHIKNIRLDTLRSLAKCLEESTIPEIREKSLNLLLHHHYYTTSHASQHEHLDLTEEIFLVLNLLNILLNEHLTIYEKTIILSRIERNPRQDVDEKYQQLITEMREKAIASTSIEEAIEKELLNADYRDARLNQDRRFEDLINQCGSVEKFSNLVHQVKSRLERGSDRSNYIRLLNFIGINHLSYVKTVFEDIRTNFPDMVAEAITIVRYLKNDEHYFDSVLEWLWTRKENYMAAFYWLLTFGKDGDISTYKKSDLKYFEYAVDQCSTNPSMYDHVRFHIVEYAYLDKEKVFSLVDKLFKTLPEQKQEDLAYSLFEQGKNYHADFKDEILRVYEDNSSKVDLTKYKHNQYLRFVDKHFGFGKLYDLFDKFVEKVLAGPRQWEYELHRYQYINDSISAVEKTNRYFLVTEKYLAAYVDNQKKYMALISIFRPDINLTDETATGFKKLIDKYSENKDSLLLLAKAIQSFYNNSENWLKLMRYLAEHYIASLDGDPVNFDEKLEAIFGNDYCHNMGGRSKSGAGPYPEDVHKKKLLDEMLTDHMLNPQIAMVLQDAKEIVEKAIQEEIDRDTMEMGW